LSESVGEGILNDELKVEPGSPLGEKTAVQAAAPPAAYRSWKGQAVVSAENNTFAGGVPTGTAYELPFSVYTRGLDDFVLLDEDELYEGIALAAFHARNLASATSGSTASTHFRTTWCRCGCSNAATQRVPHEALTMPR
jgi:threonine dehydratase